MKAIVASLFISVRLTAATITAASGSFTDVNTAYGTCVNGDTLAIPAGSNAWTSQLNVAKKIYIKGSGTNSATGTIIQLDTSVIGSQGSVFKCSIPFTEVSDIQFRGVYQANSGWLLRFSTNWCNAHDCHFTQCLSATIMDGLSLVYHCSFLDCTRMGRAFGPGDGQDNWNKYSPVTYNGTNWAAWEDNVFEIDANMLSSLSPQVLISSQQGALWICRFCYFKIANFSYAPLFDSHGETDPGPLRGNIGVQVYSNTVAMSGTSDWDKFVDIRGGGALVYSNSVTGWSSSSGVYMRSKDGETANYNNDPVTNVWIWKNLMDGSAMPAVVEANDAAIIVLHTHFETNAPSPLLSVVYPHPLRPDAPGAFKPPRLARQHAINRRR